MKPKEEFTFDAEILVGITFVGALIVGGLAYYFFFR